jgi:hypothetical protein
LEVYYSLESPPPYIGALSGSLQTAQLEDSLPPRRVFWQLVLPEDEHLLVPPDNLSSEMAWATDRLPIGQRPVMDQRQLEAWMKASRQPLLPRGSNEYLFGGLAQWPTMSLVVAQRRLIVSLASAFVLAVGLLLIHVPRMRSPGVVLILAIMIVAAALMAPLAALITAQGAILGMAIAIAATVLAWLASGRTTVAAPAVNSTAGRARDSSIARVVSPRADRSSRLSATAPAATHIVEARP